MCQEHLFSAILYSLQLLGSKYEVIISMEAKHTVTHFTSSLMFCIRAFTYYRRGLSHFPMLIQVISLLTQEPWHTRITLPTITYNIPADSIFKEKTVFFFFSSNGSSIEKKLKTENNFHRDYSLRHWGGQMQLWSQYFLTAPTLMANKQLGIPPFPSPKQIAIYIYLHWQAARVFGGSAPQACSVNPGHLVSWLNPCLHDLCLWAEPAPGVSGYGQKPF